MYYSTTYQSIIGQIRLVCDLKGKTLIKVLLEGQVFPFDYCDKDDLDIFKIVKDWLDKYFSGLNPPVEGVPLTLMGSDFQQEVWQILKEIEYGQTITYGMIAGRIATTRGKGKMSAQAVGSAVGANPLPIIIPCHRVIGTSTLRGYVGGIGKKITLLELEGVDLAKFKDYLKRS